MAWTAPKTYTVGEVLTAATMNQQVRDNLNALRKADIRTATGFNNAAFTYVTMATDVLADFGGWAAGSGGYWTAPYAGRFEVTLNGIWSGFSGSGTLCVGMDRYDSAGSALQEVLARQESAVTLTTAAVNAHALGVFASGERLYFGAFNTASGSAGTVALRASVIARG